jgi:maltooligosyltrehalose trehalohydrolase
MKQFRVWAPRAKTVELVTRPVEQGQAGEETRQPMQAADHGWWGADAPADALVVDYGFVLDGEGPYPDPRSPYQPYGVHGLSRTVDHSAFPWTDGHFQARPLASAVLYELHVGTFTAEGTFDSAIPRLDDLSALGITHVELLPVNAFPGERGWGYDGVDLFAPHTAYGGPDGLKRLVDACHARGLGVILDVVYNHVGPSGNYLDKFGPYHSDRHMTNWGEAMNFDGPGSDEVRRFFIDNARMWLRDYHFDALRIDAVHAIIDGSAVHFLEALAEAVARLSVETGRHLALIAESDLNDPRIVRPVEQGGYGIDAQWADDFHHALHALLTGEQNGYYKDYRPWDSLVKALTDVFVFDGTYSGLRDRRHGRPAGQLPGYHFLGYIQNHDQIGNRAQGERISHLVGPELAKVAAAVILTAPFIPMLFMGEEWAASSPFQYFTDHEEELGRLVSEGRRSEFGDFGWEPEQVPDPQDPETFRRSRLNWEERSQEPHASVLAWHQTCIALRRSMPALENMRLQPDQVQVNPEAGWLLIDRGAVRLACNVSEAEVTIPLASAEGEILAASTSGARLSADGVVVPGQSAVFFRPDMADTPTS